MGRIRIVHLQTHLPSSGNAAYRLHEAMGRIGIYSTMLSLTADLPTTDLVDKMGRFAKLYSKLNYKIESVITLKSRKEFGFFSYPILGNNISSNLHVLEADVIYLHWAIGGYLNFKNIEQIAKLQKPIVVFMHDMWTITGGCHHSFECEKFKKSCSRCQILSHSIYDFAKSEFLIKLRLYSNYDNFYFVAPSEWLFQHAKQSALIKGKPVFKIPNIVDFNVFQKMDKADARKIFKINCDEYIITFGAVSVDSPYKGWEYLQKALFKLKKLLPSDKKASVLVFGNVPNDEVVNRIPFRAKFLGRIDDENTLARVYNAADLFIAPSVAETFGLVALESLGCGTPVVAFNVGGLPDIIVHEQNGYLAKYRDSDDLANGIIYCMVNDIIGFVPAHLSEQMTIEKHVALLRQIKNDGKITSKLGELQTRTGE